MTMTRVQVSRPVCVLLASASVTFGTLKLLQWRARKRARKTVERLQDLIKQGAPLINYEDLLVRERILNTALRRASNWMKLSEEDYAKPLVGQVGGVSHHKKPLLTLSPDYVLKPLLLDHRGIREIAFYEAIRILSQNPINATYSTFLTGGKKKQSAVFLFGEAFDTLALALAIFMKDNAVAESEGAIQAAWRAVKREIEMIRRLANFTAPYYGVMGQRGISAAAESRFGVKEGAHLLLHDLTKNYSKPCVMDLKMGTQSYEPDAPADKRLRESSKYPQQATFGFRIVGMRMYVPDHLDADTKGYRHFGKSYGRSLSKREDLLDAMRLFFSSGTFGTSTERDGATKTNGETTSTEEKVRTRVLSTILQQLRPLRRWFEENKSLRFYASSLLIVYEGDVSKEFGSRDIATIKMIDFGRVRRVSGIDNGYNTGLHELKHLFTDVLVEEQERQRPPKVASADSAVL